LRTISKKGIKRVTPSVTAPGDTNLSDAAKLVMEEDDGRYDGTF